MPDIGHGGGLAGLSSPPRRAAANHRAGKGGGVKLLHVVPTYVPSWRHGGPIAAVHGLCKALAARGHQVTVFTTAVHGSATLDVRQSAPVAVDALAAWDVPVS